MRNVIDILYSVTGQSLYFDAPEGRPSSITSSQVFENCDGDDDTAESALSGSAAVETNPDTTFDAASGFSQSDPRVCNLTATTGCTKGRRYLATNAAGESEWVEVIAVSSGASVTARQPLENDYAASDTFESTRITHAIDSTWVAESNNISDSIDPNPRYRWRVEYVVGGVTYVHAVWFDLVRYSGTHTVTGLDVDRAFPGFLDALPTHYREDMGAELIAEAYRQVKLDLYQDGKADQMARNGEVIDDLVLHKAASLAEQSRVVLGAGSLDAAEMAASRYQSRFNHLIREPKIPFDQSGDGAGTNAQRLPLFRR